MVAGQPAEWQISLFLSASFAGYGCRWRPVCTAETTYNEQRVKVPPTHMAKLVHGLDGAERQDIIDGPRLHNVISLRMMRQQ